MRFDLPTNPETMTNEIPDLLDKIRAMIDGKEYDVRSVFTALTMCAENVREYMRLASSDKDSFDTYMRTLELQAQSLASKVSRPIFESAMKDSEVK